jgi:hypothetical protein
VIATPPDLGSSLLASVDPQQQLHGCSVQVSLPLRLPVRVRCVLQVLDSFVFSTIVGSRILAKMVIDYLNEILGIDVQVICYTFLFAVVRALEVDSQHILISLMRRYIRIVYSNVSSLCLILHSAFYVFLTVAQYLIIPIKI